MIPVPIIEEITFWPYGVARVEPKADRILGNHYYLYFRVVGGDPTRLEPTR